MGTDYSDQDFKISWEGIKEVYTVSQFLITLSDGRRYNGRLESSSSSQKINLLSDTSLLDSVDAAEVVYLKAIDQDFSSRLYAAIDVDYSITRAKSLTQFNLRGQNWLHS